MQTHWLMNRWRGPKPIGPRAGWLAGLLCGLVASTGCYVVDPAGNVVSRGPLYQLHQAVVGHHQGQGAGAGGCESCGGCGELYVDEWVNHPPRTGPKHGAWGYAYDGCGCDGPQHEPGCGSEHAALVEPGCGYEHAPSAGGCASCGSGGETGFESSSMMEGAPVESELMPVPSAAAHAPARTRKIFRQRQVSPTALNPQTAPPRR